MNYLEQWARDSDLNYYCNGIVPIMGDDGNFTGKASIAYEFRWQGHDLIAGYKSLIEQLAISIRELQRANREMSAVWTQERANPSQIECGVGECVCPFGYDKQGIGRHYHDIAQYVLGE